MAEAVTTETQTTAETPPVAASVQAPAKSAAELAAEQSSVVPSLADADLASIGDTYLTDGKPDFAKIADALKRVQDDVPAADADYELAFPADFDVKGADGEVVKLDPADPIVAKFKEIAKARGLGQGAVADLMAVYGDIVRSAVTENTEAVKAVQASEFGKIDADRSKAEARVTAAARGIKAALGKDKDALAAGLINELRTAESILAVEELLKSINGDGLPNPIPHSGSGKKSAVDILYS